MLVLFACLAPLIVWVIHNHLERRSVETQILQDTCEEHRVFCCPWCLGDEEDEFFGAGSAHVTATRS